MNVECTKYLSTRELLNYLYTDSDFSFDVNELKKNGLIEECDLIGINEPILRKNCARIIHLYMKKEMSIPDLEDISGAGILKDLYDCRVCVNHIAQVYLRGIMEGFFIPQSENQKLGIWLFEGNKYMTVEEAKRSIDVLIRFRRIYNEENIK